MNMLRLIAIALPVMLLMGCGGGGGGGSAAAPTTPMTMMPPGMDDQMTPLPDLEPLPGFRVTQGLSSLQSRFSGTAPAITDETQIISGVQTVATASDTITMQNIVKPGIQGLRDNIPIDPNCSAGTSCTATIPNAETVTFSLADIEDISLIDDTNLEKFNSETRAVMDVSGVKIIESHSAGRQDDDTRLAFQTYGGWLDNSVFAMERIEVTEGSNTTVYIKSFTFGKASGSNPTGTGQLTWSGVAVGVQRSNADLHPFQGTVTIDIDDPDSPDVDVSMNLRELAGIGSPINSSWDNLTLTNGTFTDTDAFDYIEGSFYGDGHEEVGGIFRTLNTYGAFGAKRQ